jgi:hypothetical protein
VACWLEQKHLQLHHESKKLLQGKRNPVQEFVVKRMFVESSNPENWPHDETHL